MLAFRILVTFAALAAAQTTPYGFGKRGATWAVLVESQGRDCNGGTASSEEQHELKGTKLELVHTLDAVAH